MTSRASASLPLNLAAVEARMNSTLGEEQALAPDVQALLVALRAHREALESLLANAPTLGASVARTEQWLDTRDRAATVLAMTTDG